MTSFVLTNFITHYSRGEPFQSMTGLPREEWESAVSKLKEETAWGLARFSDFTYLEQRLVVEKQMRHEFISCGGKPVIENPIYFFLGRNKRFEEHPKNQGYVVDLKDISPDVITFTYGDSMLSFNEENRALSGDPYQNPLCARIFRLEDLKSLFLDINYPKQIPLSIEVQLWVQPSSAIVKKLSR